MSQVIWEKEKFAKSVYLNNLSIKIKLLFNKAHFDHSMDSICIVYKLHYPDLLSDFVIQVMQCHSTTDSRLPRKIAITIAAQPAPA